MRYLIAATVLGMTLLWSPVFAEPDPVAKDLLKTVTGKLKDALPPKLATSLMPDESDEVAAGRAVAASLLAVAPPVADHGLQRYVNEVGRWVAAQSERPDLPWHFGVVESADLNAFACPGGYVLITSGLYNSLSDTAELAGVLAHEVAHVVARHHLKLSIASQAIAEGARRVESAVNPGGDDIVQNLVGAGAGLMGRKLDKGSEYEADRMAVVLAARAGYDPFGLPAVLLKLGQLPAVDDRVALLFSTHPLPAERLRQLDAAMGDRLNQYGAQSSPGMFYRPVTQVQQ